MTNDQNNSDVDELSSWYLSLRDGGSRATQRLWNMFFERMVQVARKKMWRTQRAVSDEEDVALSAFKSFCLGFQKGSFGQGGDPEQLWPLLVKLTLNKAVDHVRREQRVKRGGGGVKAIDDLDERDDGPCPLIGAQSNAADKGRGHSRSEWTDIISHEPTPEMQAVADDSFEHLLNILDKTGDASLRAIALGSISGYPPREIADNLECTPRTIQRKLQTIRALWEKANR